MILAEFTTVTEAREHRSQHGGWLFLSDCGRTLWFSLAFTASRVMLHGATRGMNGVLA